MAVNKTITLWQNNQNRRGEGNKPEGFTRRFDIKPGDTAKLAEAVQYDNCPGLYERGYRTGNNFRCADCMLADIDNTHSDDPADWITPEHVQAAMSGVEHYYYPSQNHMKEKRGKSPRPKYHYMFSIDPATDAETYKAHMTSIIEYFPQLHFDTQVTSPAQLNYGVEGAQVSYVAGDKNLSAFLREIDNGGAYQTNEVIGSESKQDKAPSAAIIPEGQRNSTLSHFAGCILKKYGDTDGQARIAFDEEAAKCSPPLDNSELSAIWKSALSFYKKVQADPAYIPPEQYNEEFSLEPADYTDVGEALVLAKEYGAGLRHCTATKYIVFTGQVWEENAARARGCLHELTERQLEENTPVYIAAAKALEKTEQAVAEAKQDGSAIDKATTAAALTKAKRNLAPIAAYQKFILGCRDSKTITGVMTEAQTPLEIKLQELDKAAHLLNTPGGEIDLRTNNIIPHDPEHFHTKITAVAPDDKGAEIWRDCIERTTCYDSGLAEYLQLIAGQAAVGKVYAENLIIAYGNGKNGKSTVFNTISRVLGDYSGQISAETLTTGRKNGKNWELGELRGKRMIIAPELEEGTRLDSAFVKKISSTDKIGGEKKYKDPFTFEPSHTTILYTNHLPKIGSTDAGTWRRLIVVPFNAVFEGKNDCKNYADYLFCHAGGAVLSWIAEGAKKFIAVKGHIEQPECVKQAIKEYREANDWLNNFLTECCEIDPKYKEKSGELYNHYRIYCDRNGEYIRSAQDFKTAAESACYNYHRVSAGVFVHGVRINDEFLRGRV